ncbi:MAG: GldG family protein, partial [Alphaproteobacteria bacterium]|nr:GldG family protein [Alphaproteobacteria bacterium]
MTKKTYTYVLSVIIWIAVCLGLGRLFGGEAVDLSKDKLFTLNSHSQKTAQSIKAPINFRLYISSNLASYNRELYNYASYITDILGQYQKQNPQNIKFEVIRPKPYSAEAQIAEEIGAAPIAFGDEYAYFALQIFNDKQKITIPELIPERRPYFENDINRILSTYINPKKPIVGFLSPEIPVFKSEGKIKSWTVIDQMAQYYKLLDIPLTSLYIPADIKALVLLNPQELPPRFLYTLDQYVMGGGKLLVFVDPYSEVNHFYKGYPPRNKTNITDLLSHWGIEYDKEHAIGNYAQSVRLVDGTQYPLWFFVSSQGFEKLHFRTPGSIELNPQENLQYEILLKTTSDGGNIKSEKLRYSNKKNVIEQYFSTQKSYNLAVKASGEFVSYYINDQIEPEENTPPYIYISSPKAAVAVVVDTDFFGDDGWALNSNRKNLIYGTAPYADNAEYILSLIDYLLTEDKNSFAAYTPKYFDNANIAAEIAKPQFLKTSEIKN